ncbi:hypothetical protein [Actinoplanes sp. NPDC089786]|uniref:hypothetical protein n=1 Tax=Actinoplanes sp. NPDC089786 TaxID=3155185 RepID=UPI003420D45C
MTTSAGDRLLEPEIWEAALRREFFAGSLALSTAQPFRIKHVRRLTARRTGSYVAIVRLNADHGRLGHVVLMLLPPNIAEAETLGVQRAKSSLQGSSGSLAVRACRPARCGRTLPARCPATSPAA